MSDALDRQDTIGRQAVAAAKALGATNAREAAEIALKRSLTDREWERVREAWERSWRNSLAVTFH
jgi:hypothetical protein